MEQNQLKRKLFQIEHTLKEGVSTFEVVAEWDTIKEVTDTLGYYREGIDQALKKGYVSNGYFWMWNFQWMRGDRPDINKQVRNKRVYAYNAEKTEFIGRYKNAVLCSKDLNVSVSNIRLVCDNDKYNSKRQTHKDYYFTYKPLFEEDDVLADILGLRDLRSEVWDKVAIDEQINEKKRLLQAIQEKNNKVIDLKKYEDKSGFVTKENTKFY